MATCTFCGREITPGTGMLFVYKTGKFARFCSGKCEKHVLKLNRKPLNTKWVTSLTKKKK